MTAKAARLWLVNVSLVVIGAEFVFFLLGPLLGYPLTFAQSLRLLEIITPTFFGYLGSAAHFLFKSDPLAKMRPGSSGLLGVLVRGPVILFVLITGVTLVAFGVSNRVTASAGSGMDIDTLALCFASALSLLAVTTTVLVGYLFGGGSGSNAH
jgi:hypothetical protein